MIAGRDDGALGREAEFFNHTGNKLASNIKLLRRCLVRQVAGNHKVIEQVETEPAVSVVDVSDERLKVSEIIGLVREVQVTEVQNADRLIRQPLRLRCEYEGDIFCDLLSPFFDFGP